jgi:hypothetical protein
VIVDLRGDLALMRTEVFATAGVKRFRSGEFCPAPFGITVAAYASDRRRSGVDVGGIAQDSRE